MTKKKARLLIIVLSCLLAAALSALAVLIVINITHSGSKSAEVTVKNNYINKSAESGRITYAGSFVKPGFADVLQKSSTDSITLTLNSRNSDESVPFRVTNMFPGDVETKVFRVGVSYKNSVTVHYKAAVRQGYEKLAEVLKCKIVMKDSGTVLYDGLMKDMPEAVDYKLPTVTQNTETELVYEISGYLETSVGNDYQEKDLIADFKWWVSDSENKNLNPPKTGDTTMTLLWAAIIGAAAMLLVVLVIEDVKFGDKLKVWNFFTGKYDESDVAILVDHGEQEYEVANLTFSDGTVLRTIADHGLFDYEANKFVYILPNNCEKFLNHRFVQYNEDGTYNLVTLTDVKVTTEVTNAYSITSANTMDAFAGSILTLAPPENFYNWIPMGDKLQYDVAQFNEDVKTYGLYDYDTFKDYVTYEQYLAFNGAYLKIPVSKGNFTFDDILELIELYGRWMQDSDS